MRTNGQTTIDTLQDLIENLYVVPALFQEPKDGWVNWAVKFAGLHLEVNPTTIAGRLIRASAPSWAYGMMMPSVLNGGFEQKVITLLQKDPEFVSFATAIQNASSVISLDLLRAQLAYKPQDSHLVMQTIWGIEAKKARLSFQTGAPLYIGVYESLERYQTFEPVLTYLGEQKYRVSVSNARIFEAENHAEALRIARKWFLAQREKEVDLCKKIAAKLVQGKIQPHIYDRTMRLMQKTKEIRDVEGTRIAWQNGSHGNHIIQGDDWCYSLLCSPEKAVQMALLAAYDANKNGHPTFLHYPVPDQELYAFTRWELVDNDLCWESEGVTGKYSLRSKTRETEKGIISIGDQPYAALILQQSMRDKSTRGTFLARVSSGRTEYAKSVFTGEFMDLRSSALMWAVWKVLQEYQKLVK